MSFQPVSWRDLSDLNLKFTPGFPAGPSKVIWNKMLWCPTINNIVKKIGVKCLYRCWRRPSVIRVVRPEAISAHVPSYVEFVTARLCLKRKISKSILSVYLPRSWWSWSEDDGLLGLQCTTACQCSYCNPKGSQGWKDVLGSEQIWSLPPGEHVKLF